MTTKSSSTYNILSISYNEDGELNSIKMPYVVTPAGIRFCEELTVNGVAMQEFRFDETSGEMASIDG